VVQKHFLCRGSMNYSMLMATYYDDDSLFFLKLFLHFLIHICRYASAQTIGQILPGTGSFGKVVRRRHFAFYFYDTYYSLH
jgi:hypothetical protein